MEDRVELDTGPVQQPRSNVLLDIETRTTRILVAVLLDTLSACDEVLFGRAQQANNGMRQAQYFDDQRQLRDDRDIAANRFRTACRHAFRNMGQPLPGNEAAKRGGGELHLVADEDLELDLALLRIGTCCEDVASRVRHQVRRRLQVLLGLNESMTSPFCGAAIAHMCRAAIAPIELGMESRLLVLKQLERNLANAMEPVLEFANSALLAHGVLPQLRATPAVSRGPAPPASPPAAAATQAVAAASAAAISGTDLNALMAQVAEWLSQNGADAAPEAASTPALEPEQANAVPAETQEREPARERRRLEIAERRSAELTRARELRAAAEHSADAVLGGVIDQAHVPQSICEVMRGPLRRHLQAVHARRGESSTEWRNACKLVRDIGWALDPESARSEQAHWREMLPAIGESLRSALHSARIVNHEANRVVRGFSDHCEHLLSLTPPAQVATEIGAIEGASVDAALAAQDEPESCTEATTATPATAHLAAPSFTDALRQVRQLTPGRWFELPDDHGRCQRAKLVWTSATTERCLFVNGQGKLVADRAYARVAHDLAAGSFREIDSAGNRLT